MVRLLIILVLIFSINCDRSTDSFIMDSTPDTYINLLESAWDSYMNENYEVAVDLFQQAADRDAIKPEPYLGLGWCYARLLDLEKSNANFTKTIAFAFFDSLLVNTFLEESYAGLAAVNYASQNYEQAVEYCDSVLYRNEYFNMRYDNSVNSESIFQQKLYCNFYLNNIESVYNDLISLGFEFSTVQFDSGYGIITNVNTNNGLHEAVLSNGDCYSGEENSEDFLITIDQVSSCDFITTYSIDYVYTGSNNFTLLGNPVLIPGSRISLDFFSTYDYGEFIDELLLFLSMIQN